MLPVTIYRRLCERLDAKEFAQRYPHHVLVQLAVGSHMLTGTSPRETLYRARGLGTRRKSRRAQGSAYYVYRLRNKPGRRSPRVSVGFLTSNDVVIHEATISRIHANIEQRNTGFVIVEAGSSNGVRVNDTVVPSGQAAPIKSGDRIAFGNVSTLFMSPPDLHNFVRRVITG